MGYSYPWVKIRVRGEYFSFMVIVIVWVKVRFGVVRIRVKL